MKIEELKVGDRVKYVSNQTGLESSIKTGNIYSFEGKWIWIDTGKFCKGEAHTYKEI